jgi:hypothetical protein
MQHHVKIAGYRTGHSPSEHKRDHGNILPKGSLYECYLILKVLCISIATLTWYLGVKLGQVET